MSIPFTLPVGAICVHAGVELRFEGMHGPNILMFVETRTRSPYFIVDPKTGGLGTTDLAWVTKEYLARRFKVPGPVRTLGGGRTISIEEFGEDVCRLHDMAAPFRMRWALAASRASLPRTDVAYAAFIETNREKIVEEGHSAPGPSTLRRLVRQLDEQADRPFGPLPATLVSRTGRAKGRSQLPPREDSLVHEFALRFWDTPLLRHIRDAYAQMYGVWDELRAAGVEGLGERCPSYEALRLRIRSTETYDTVKAKYGEEEARRRFHGVGELVQAKAPFDRVYIDGTELEQIVVFDDDLKIPAGKVKAVRLVDQYTDYWFPSVIFHGPYRSEMSIEAIIRSMTINTSLTDEQMLEEPWAPWVFGPARTLVPDNDRTLVPAGYLPTLLMMGTEVELPKTYHEDAKSPEERSHRTLKERLRALPGTVLAPSKKRDLKRDPVAEASLSIRAIQRIDDQLTFEHNATAREEHGWRSPFDLMKECLAAGNGPPINLDPDYVRRTLGRLVPNRRLTRGGLEYDGIIYRADEVSDILEHNACSTPMRERNEDSGSVSGNIIVHDGNLNFIEFHDQARKMMVTLWSTQPEYTDGLSRYEHQEYRRRARLRKKKFKTEDQRLRLRRETLDAMAEEAPMLNARGRSTLAALRASETVRALSGRRAERAMPPMPSELIPAADLGADLDGLGSPPPGAGPKRKNSRAAPRDSAEAPVGAEADPEEWENIRDAIDWDAIPTSDDEVRGQEQD